MKSDRSFHVEVGSGRLDTYPVVARCPEGEAEGSFVIPFAASDLKDLLPRLARSVRASATHPWMREVGQQLFNRADRAADRWVREAGKQLFQALVRDDVARLYRADANRAFVLHLDPGNPDFHRLADLPWEILHDPERNCYVSLLSPMVRSLHVGAPAGRLPGPPLRILAVSSNPADRPPLRLSEEARTLAGAGIEVHLLENPTSEELAEHASSGSYNALHFMGHGKFDPETGEGFLVLCSAASDSDPVPADWLASLLVEGGFGLAVLNSCDTARTCDAEGRDPFLGVAGALVAAGLPAAVAMQLPISDAAALTFSRGFYRTLALGDPLGRAVVQGRRAIRNRDVKSLEWSTPVLYLREREEPEEGIGEPPPPEVPTPWALCGLALALQALAWTSLIWLCIRVPSLFQKGTSIVDSFVVSTVLVVFVLTLSVGFFRLGSFLARVSGALAWTVAALAALAGVSLWFSLFS